MFIDCLVCHTTSQILYQDPTIPIVPFFHFRTITKHLDHISHLIACETPVFQSPHQIIELCLCDAFAVLLGNWNFLNAECSESVQGHAHAIEESDVIRIGLSSDDSFFLQSAVVRF
jgi:hypothetical protein